MNTTQNPGDQNRPGEYPHDPRPDQGRHAPGQPKPGAPDAPPQPETEDGRQDRSGTDEQKVR
jgi:hypothetical protein